MSTEPNATPDPTQPPQGSEPNSEANPKPEAPAQETDWKAEARKWEQRAKADAGAAAKLAEIENAAKSEAERQSEALAASEAKVKEYEQRAQVATWKAAASTESGVPVDALAGSTEEEIKAHAEILKTLIGAQKSTGNRAPREGLTPPINSGDEDRRTFVRTLTGRD